MTIYGFPVSGSAYTASLYDAVRRTGADVREGVWSGRWLLSNVRAGDTLHLHWPSFHYYDPRSQRRSVVGLLRFMVILGLMRARGARVVWTAHNLYPHDGAERVWVHRLARRFVVRIVDAIFAHGPTAAGMVRSEFAPADDKLRVIWHGHWVGAFADTVGRAEARRRLGLGDADYVYLFIGLCKPYKGLEALIDAAGRLPDDAKVVIAGKFQSDEYERQIRARVVQAPSGRIHLVPGYIEDDGLQWFLNAADAVVLPYRSILTSGAAVLALSFGRPVVAPRLGALMDIVDDRCGVLYEPGRPQGLVEALEEVRRRSYDANALRDHIRQFSWADAADALAQEARRLSSR